MDNFYIGQLRYPKRSQKDTILKAETKIKNEFPTGLLISYLSFQCFLKIIVNVNI